MARLLGYLLGRYDDRSFVLKLKARFIACCYLTVFLVFLVAIIYTGAANLKSPLSGYALRLTALSPLIGGLAISILGLIIFIRGYFSQSAHLLMVCGMATVWAMIFFDQTYVVSRLDTIVFIIALLAMMPIVVLKRPLDMAIYAGINILMLFIFMAHSGGTLNLPIASIISYLADNTIAILAVTTFSYQIYTINQRALEKAEHDIQKRMQAEETLRKSEERYRTILNEMSEGYYEVDLAGNYTFFNEAFYNLFGYAKKEMMGTNYSCYAAEEAEAKKVYKVFNRIFKTRIPVKNHEWEIIRKDGERRTLQYFSAAVIDAENIPIGFRGIVRDITDSRRADAERENLQAQLLQAQKMEAIGTLAGGVAHDYNNMLGVILGHAEMALVQIAPEDPLHSRISLIQQAAQRSADITRQLLAFARRQTIEPRILDLNHTVQGMLNLLRRLIGEDIDLIWDPGREVCMVRMDPSQIDQILANLCVNARDAIAGVGKVIIQTDTAAIDEDDSIRHSGMIPGNYVILAVSDNGCGMEEETLALIFEPFFTTKEIGRGTGLGLATVYGVVKQNNGYIKVHSEPGKGTTFKIYLPCQAEKGTHQIDEPRIQREVRGSETILLVEDEPMILEMTTMLLEELGYMVLTAPAPGEAIRLAREYTGPIHLLLTDVVMPEMNGRDLAEKITDLYPDIRLLFMSGYTTNVIAHQGVLDEGVTFIQKPFSLTALSEKLRVALASVSTR